MKAHKIAWALSYLVVIGGLLATQHLLPDPVATHFNERGPNGFMGRDQFLVWAISFVSVMNLIFLPFGLDAILPKVPARWINVPHRDAWLRGDLDAFYQRLGLAMGWSAAFMNLVIGVIHGAVVAYNTGHATVAAVNASAWVTMAVCSVMLVPLYLAFRPPERVPPIEGEPPE